MPMSHVCLVLVFVATILLIFVSLDSNVAAQSSPTFDEKSLRCAKQQTCGACVAADCVWCRQPHYDTNTTARCSDSRGTLVGSGCSDDMIQAANVSLTVHNDTQPHSGDGERDAIQLAPQNITVRLTPNKPFTFPVTFRLAENFPVDLYFLMDVSITMESFRKTLVNMTDQLAEAIGNITTNYRLGLGAYVDKLVLPYCNKGQAPFTFRNILSLTRDKKEFQRKVNDTTNVGNIDFPEAVLDAVVQVIACRRQIGWRDQSRKLIVISTDGDFHIAGDGLLGGIIKPNDRQCHLDAVGDLTLMDDYPSISEVAELVVDNNINLIFAVPISKPHAVEAYSLLMRHIEGSNVAHLESNCNNVVQLIRESYEKISSTVLLKSDTNDSDVSVSFWSRCLSGSGPERETSTCEGLQMRQNVTFDVTVEVRVPDGKCPADRRLWRRSAVIYPAGLTDTLTVNIELDCECPCEQPAAAEPTSHHLCDSRGSLKCGICACDAGFYGDTCECSSDTTVCRSSGNASTPECSDRGRCDCGRCQCNAISSAEPNKFYSGRFCECNDYACGRYAGRLCGGSSRGKCVCGECNCTAGWTGGRCECSTSTDRCMTKTGKLCNDAGTCECNECRCTMDLYKGPTCEDCPTCTDGGRCEQFVECIKCHFQSQSCPSTCANTAIDLTDDVETDVTDEWPSNETVVCRARLDEYCVARFAYNYMTGALRADRRKVCTKPPDLTMIIVGVVIGILVVGLVLLFIWKAYVTAHDRREYAQFKDHLNAAATSATDNPLYRNAVTKYQNPTYDRGSHDKLA